MKSNQLIISLSIVFLALHISACKEIERRAGERQTKSTEDLISKSKELQNLEKICRELPLFNKITPAVKSISRQNDMLFYDYKLKQDFDSLKEIYKLQLPKEGWILKNEDEMEIAERQIEFEKGQYWIQVSFTKFRDDNYAISCKDSTIAH